MVHELFYRQEWVHILLPIWPPQVEVHVAEKSDEDGDDDHRDKQEEDEEDEIGVIQPKYLKDFERVERSIADKGWSRRGWTGRSWPGRYVGCPLAPDGSEWQSVSLQSVFLCELVTVPRQELVTSYCMFICPYSYCILTPCLAFVRFSTTHCISLSGGGGK